MSNTTITPLDTYKSWATQAERKLAELESYRESVQRNRDKAQNELDQVDAAIAALKRFRSAESP